MGIAERRYQRLTAGEGILRNPYRGEKIDKVVKVETKGDPEIWGVKCRSDVTGTKKNLNVQWNSRPKADRQYNGIQFKEQADARAEGIGRELGKARLDAKTRRNYRKLVMARGEAHADTWLRRILG